MSVQDFIKKSVLESGAFDGATITNIFLGIITALAVGALIYYIYSKFYVGVIFSRSFAVIAFTLSLSPLIVSEIFERLEVSALSSF